MFTIEPSWEKVLKEELNKPYISSLSRFVATERETSEFVYPPEELVFNAFDKTPFEKVKVVIVGQDPYHRPGQANGLSFSVNPGVKIPPSLRNIYKELQEDLGVPEPTSGCLESWAKQGVLLLNATLTVNEGSPLSHHGKGWEEFTDAIIYVLAKRKDPVIFLLWGKNAQEKCQFIENSHHYLLKAAHPSPFSAYRGFFGCQHFSKANELLQQLGKEPIDWGRINERGRINEK